MNKVFCMGLWRTGTKSFGEAMRVLGYKVHSAFEPFIDDMHLKTIQELHSPDTWPEGKLLRIWRMAERHDAMSDSPWHFVYRKLIEWYPDAKFVLTLRKSDKALGESEIKHNLMHGKKLKDLSRAFFIDRYKYHNEKIRDFFKGNKNFHECAIEDMNWKWLCNVVGKPIPEKPFPWLNKGDSYA